MSTIALYGSLSEVMSTEMVASILDELPEAYDAPPELCPSVTQWEAIAKTCSGVISATNFSLVSEHFMGLSGDGPVTPHPFVIKNPGPQSRDCGEPKHIASALHALGKLSTGSLIAIELRGGAACGLLGALGYYFLGLEVEIRRGHVVLYRSASAEIPVQILVTYGAEANQTSFYRMQVASRSYRIYNISSIIGGRAKDLENDNYIMSGRVPWGKMIQTTLGAAGQELLKASYSFSQILGNAARIFAALASSEPNNLGIQKPRTYYSTQSFKSAIVHNENSYGKGFVHFMMARFSELATLDRDTMETCLEYPLAKAHKEFEAAMSRMVVTCNCVMCNEPKGLDEPERYKTYCIPLVAETFIITVRNLALVYPNADLDPYRSGLEKLCRIHEFCPGAKPKFRIDRIIEDLSMDSVYKTAELVFTGRRENLEFRQETRSASSNIPPVFSAHGMTFYLGILQDLSNNPGAAATLHVVPGTMTLDSGRTYAIARDSLCSGSVGYSVINYQALSSLPSPTDTGSAELVAELAVQETLGELCIEFCFTRANKPLCSMGVAELVDRLARVSFLVHYPRRRCIDLKAPLTSVYTVDGEGKVDPQTDVSSGRLVVIRRLQGNLVARLVALFQNSKFAEMSKDVWAKDVSDVPSEDQLDLLYHENVIMKSDECWSCCIKAAFSPARANIKKNFLPVVYIL